MIILASFLLTCVNANPPSLRDAIPKGSYTPLYDTLGAIVDAEYANQHIGNDEVVLPEHEPYRKDLPSIEELNEPYSDILFEGDILVKKKFLQNLIDHTVNTNETKRAKRALAYKTYDYPNDSWNKGVAYTFHNKFPAAYRKTVLAAMNFFSRETCVRFHPRRASEADYLTFINYEKGCFSQFGRQGGVQAFSLGPGCNRFGVATHEMGHALGMWHEQSRMDRDKHVTLFINRVRATHTSQYDKAWKEVSDTYGEPYEIGSIMHYQPAVFSKVAGNPSLIAKNPAEQQTMGQRGGPSFIDVKLINKHYKCATRCKNKIKCYNGGYQNPNRCTWCKCPTGYGGNNCSVIKVPTVKGCSGYIEVKAKPRQFRLSMKKARTQTPRQCNYILRSPAGTRIVVAVKQINQMYCESGCFRQAVEFKMGKNKTPTGMRFCCTKGSKIRMVSGNHHVPVMLFAHVQGAPSVVFSYHYVRGAAKRAGRVNETIINGDVGEDENNGVEVLDMPADESDFSYESKITHDKEEYKAEIRIPTTTPSANESEEETAEDLPYDVDQDLIDPLDRVDEQQLRDSYDSDEPTDLDVFRAFREPLIQNGPRESTTEGERVDITE